MSDKKLKTLPKSMRIIAITFSTIVLCVGILVVLHHWSYSKAQITGYPQRISEPDSPCSAWVGELELLPTSDAQTGGTFYFSTQNNDLISKFNSTIGYKVILYYENRLVLPVKCLKDSRHIAIDITRTSSNKK